MNLRIRKSGVFIAHLFVLISHCYHLVLVTAGLEHHVGLLLIE